MQGQELRRVQEVAQGIGAIPEFVLFPQAGGDREEGQFIDVGGLRGGEFRRADQEVCPSAGKKSERVQARTSWVRRKQRRVSCSSSGIPQQRSA